MDVLCLDKTGTLTTGDMTLHSLEARPGVSDSGLTDSLAALLGCFDVSGGTMAALAVAVQPVKQQPLALIPFSSARKLSAATLQDGRTLVLGAPTFVLPADLYQATVGRRVEEAAVSGLRVLVLAECGGAIDGETLPPVSRVLGLALLQDTLRENCAETLSFFREQGVDIRVISGDDPRTVSAIAGRAGLTGHELWVDATTLDTPDKLREACETKKVFGRVTPARKRQLVDTLKAMGHHVAMTGDGVNDIPAMKAADCSIAMAGGSDACKHAAQITLLSSDFACMPAVVNEGRRVVNNITRAASLFLVKTLYSFALSLVTLLLPMVYPFQGIQLTLVSTLTIGIPTFVLALQPNHDRLKGSFLKNVLRNAIPGALAVTVLAAVCMQLENHGWSHEVCSTLATLSAGGMGLLILAGICIPFNALRAGLLALMAAAFTGAVCLLPGVFFLTALSADALLLLAGMLAGGLALMLLARLLLDRLWPRSEK